MEILIDVIKEYPLTTIFYGYLFFSGCAKVARELSIKETRSLKYLIYKDLFNGYKKSNKKYKEKLNKAVDEFKDKLKKNEPN